MRFQTKYGPIGREPMDVSEMVDDYIGSAPDYHDGLVERLDRKFTALLKVVCLMSSKLSAGDQRDLAELLGYEEAQAPGRIDAIDSRGNVIDLKTGPMPLTRNETLERGRWIHQRFLGDLEPMPECDHTYHLGSDTSNNWFEVCSKCGATKDLEE